MALADFLFIRVRRRSWMNIGRNFHHKGWHLHLQTVPFETKYYWSGTATAIKKRCKGPRGRSARENCICSFLFLTAVFAKTIQNGLFTQHQKLLCNSQRVYPRPSNILHLLCIWVKCVGVWGKITPMKWSVSIKLYPMSKGRMLLSKILPQTSKKFTQIYLPYLWHYATLFVATGSPIQLHIWAARVRCIRKTPWVPFAGFKYHQGMFYDSCVDTNIYFITVPRSVDSWWLDWAHWQANCQKREDKLHLSVVMSHMWNWYVSYVLRFHLVQSQTKRKEHVDKFPGSVCEKHINKLAGITWCICFKLRTHLVYVTCL